MALSAKTVIFLFISLSRCLPSSGEKVEMRVQRRFSLTLALSLKEFEYGALLLQS
jgi:hypothetical protein